MFSTKENTNQIVYNENICPFDRKKITRLSCITCKRKAPSLGSLDHIEGLDSEEFKESPTKPVVIENTRNDTYIDGWDEDFDSSDEESD